MTPVKLESATPRSWVKHSTTEPLRSLNFMSYNCITRIRESDVSPAKTEVKGSDQTEHMRRLIWGFAGHTYHIVGYLMSRLICFADKLWLCNSRGMLNTANPDQLDCSGALFAQVYISVKNSNTFVHVLTFARPLGRYLKPRTKPDLFNLFRGTCQALIRPLVKGAYQKINFLISQPKHLLWVLKRTISIRWFFWAPKTYVLTDVQFNAKIFCYLNLW